jgi:glycosyltransferase involved in cell wall biosynthesis
LLKNLALFPKALAVAHHIEMERVDHIHAYWLSAPATVALVVSDLLDIPWSSSAHRWDIYEQNLLKRKAGTASFVRTISDRGRRDLVGMIDAKDHNKIRQVPVGVKIPSVTCGPTPGPLRLLCAANLIEQKGHADLLEALAIASDRGVAFTCDIVGSGPTFHRLQRSIERLGLSGRVALCGRIPHDMLLERLQSGQYDAAVLASRDDANIPMEGIPVALIEAMAAGLPCIATASGGIPELIDDSVGFLALPGDKTSIADAIERSAASAEVRASLGFRARQRVSERFNIELTGPALAELILQA